MKKDFIIHHFRFKAFWYLIKKIRTFFFSISGAQIGKGTLLSSCYIPWPSQVSIGKYCRLEHGIYFKFDNIHKAGRNIIIGNQVFLGAFCEFNITDSIHIGDYCLIASGCKFIDHDHGFYLDQKIGANGKEEKIIIGENVWLGCNVVVLKGVIIEDGAIVAAGSVVTKNIKKYEIWGGVPAKKISTRSQYLKKENNSNEK